MELEPKDITTTTLVSALYELAESPVKTGDDKTSINDFKENLKLNEYFERIISIYPIVKENCIKQVVRRYVRCCGICMCQNPDRYDSIERQFHKAWEHQVYNITKELQNCRTFDERGFICVLSPTEFILLLFFINIYSNLVYTTLNSGVAQIPEILKKYANLHETLTSTTEKNVIFKILDPKFSENDEEMHVVNYLLKKPKIFHNLPTSQLMESLLKTEDQKEIIKHRKRFPFMNLFGQNQSDNQTKKPTNDSNVANSYQSRNNNTENLDVTI